MPNRTVSFLSDGTGITAETFGNAILAQFSIEPRHVLLRWDKAVMERFFLNLKMERVWHKNYANQGEATNDIADYIVGFYNSIRLYSKLGNL